MIIAQVFLATPIVNTIIGQRDRVLDIPGTMDRGEVLLVNLKRADHLGFSRDRARLIGNLLVNAFFNAALARQADTSRPFYVYIDEAYDYLSKDIETARKVGARRGKPVILRVDAATMHGQGFKFFVSANGVWLTHAVPPDYLARA